jgi:hypothetical protein
MSTTSKEQAKIYRDKYKEQGGDEYLAHRAKLNRDWIAKNRVRYNEAKAEYRYKLKVAALHYYSNGSLSCGYCGFNSDIDALCLDHINDNGAEHRKELGCSSRGGGSGTTIYERLKAHGWMEGLQVLCFNCNTIKELRRKRNGKTSHQMLEAISKDINWK